MNRLGGVLVASMLALPPSAVAAELTRIVSSFEENHPFGFSLEAGYRRTQERSKIVREAHQNGQLVDMPELVYVSTDHRLVVEARLGLWKDLEFRYVLPIVFAQDRSWRYASGTSDSNSTIVNNCIQANGELVDVNCPLTGAGRQPLFNPTSDSYRGGLGDMTFGLAYAIFNQEKDDTKPMWIVGLDYTAPTADALDPKVATTASSRGNLGERLHRYKLYTSMSRRIGPLDPYFQIHYTLPARGPGWYSNCDAPDARNMARPQNCSDPNWPRTDTGLQPPHVGGVIFGAEVNLHDNITQKAKVALDVRGIATYVSPGRYDNELSDLFGKLLHTAEYLQYGGAVGLVAQAGASFTFQARGSLSYSTPHFLTDESIGKDLDRDGTVDVTANPREINPNFDFRTDLVSRRFRATDLFVFQLDVSARLNF
jgi:hypothetical protein